MNYPCNMIKDLLPLYVDNVCSEESKEIVEQHLSKCSDCKAYYTSLTENNTPLPSPVNQDLERQKARSFLEVRKIMRFKQLLAAIISAVILTAAIFSTVTILGSYEKVVTYADNISVAMADGSLVGRLTGSRQHQVHIKRIEVTTGGNKFTYLFFCFYDTKWDELITGKDIFSEYILCPADRGADEIDAVFYYTGDDTGIESLNYFELQGIIDESVLLWSK